MQSAALIIGVSVVAIFAEFWVHGSASSLLKSGDEVLTWKVPTQNDGKIVQWLQQFLANQTNLTTSQPVELNCPPCRCGLSNADYKIVGGEQTKINEFPWMAQLFVSGATRCGATIISSRYLVTAAHCVYRRNEDQIRIRIGEYDRSSTTETITQDFGVEKVIVHREYMHWNNGNDIAIVKLSSSIDFRGAIRPVCLAEPGLTYAGSNGIAIGWGRTHEFGTSSNILLETTVPIMTNEECRSKKYPYTNVNDNMMCAGYDAGGKDACKGDSGGPLHVVDQRKKIYRLVGIVSWGHGCANPSSPGVYTRVNRYLTWLNNYIHNDCYCD